MSLSKPDRSRFGSDLRRRALRILPIAGVVWLLSGCSGGCSRSRDAETPVEAEQPVPEPTFKVPVAFDAADTEECLRLLRSGTELTPHEKAFVIAVAQNSVAELTERVEALMHNDDNADAWNVCDELARLQWPSQTIEIVRLLRDLDLSDRDADSLLAMQEKVGYVDDCWASLHRRIPSLPSIFNQ